MIKLTKHVRHARLVKIVRRQYQIDNPGSRLFNNKSGTAFQGERLITFGIPDTKEGSGGADLLGETLNNNLPILTGVECKTGNAKLQKNQKAFRKWLKSINGIYHIARECPECWEDWEPVYKDGKIVEWVPVKGCPTCKGKGYLLES